VSGRARRGAFWRDAWAPFLFAAALLVFAAGPGCAAGDHDAAGEHAADGHAAAGHAAGGAEHPGTEAGGHDATIHHGFEDAERWTKVFDAPDRDEWQKPDEVIAGLSIRPGMVVADLGAGTGYFEAHLSKAVGPTGLVLAIDPEPDMVKYLGGRARKDGLRNVLPVLGQFDDPFLPQGHVDRVLIVDTYHHIDDRLAYFGRMRDAMASGGRVAIIDFHKRPLPVGPPPEHKLERQFVVDEMSAAGWRLADEKTTLPYQYFLIFEPASGASGGVSR
jgi:ubiquinone/menaquinone biosynthesis C-methylase UbiE